MSVCFVQAAPIFHHYPLNGGIDFKLLRASDEQVQLRRILFQSRHGTCGHRGNDSLVLEHVRGRSEDHETARDESFRLFPEYLLPDAEQRESHTDGETTSRWNDLAGVNLARDQ